MRNSLTFSRLAVGLLALAVFPAHTLTAAAPKNVILFIGDGMGFEHVKAARYYNGGPLSFESLPAQAQVTTYSANNAVTDSAAGGTAIATGRKVNNYVVSQALPGDGSDLPTSLEQFKAAGKKTGLITTTYLTHATPATFGAHVADRNSTSDVATDYLKAEAVGGSRPNILFGGGGNGLTALATTTAGYQVATDTAGFNALDLTATSPRISAQFGSTYLPYEYDYLGKTFPFPHLSQLVSKALAEIDDDPTGFFLMVEGGKIDQAAHVNDLPRTVHETLEFSRAVQVALTWAASRTDTLILVTADHETGGLRVSADKGQGQYPDVSWSSTGHTGANVPAYAMGVDAQRVTGILDNTDIYKICMGEVAPVTSTLVAKGSTWKYEASGTDLGTSWTNAAYDDSLWPSGPAELGYGDGGEKTLVPKTSPVYPCYYFRHSFTVDNPAAYSDLKLAILRDDGAVVYLNGTEVARYSMSGEVTFNSWATTAVDYAWDPAVSIPNLLVSGVNILAVEIHQCNATSSDISLDLELTATVSDAAPPVISGLLATASDVSARITWSTDKDADSLVSFSLPNAPTSTQVHNTTLTRAHNVLLQNLTPNTTYNYAVSSMDSLGNQATGGGTFNTKLVNTRPVATPPSEIVEVFEDSFSGTINLTGSDEENDPLTVTITSPPQHGTLSEDVPFVVYTPAPNWFGEDSFDYVVNDGAMDSPSATVSIAVASVNDVPVANSDSAMVLEGYSVKIPVLSNDSDIDGPSALRVTSASLGLDAVGEIVLNTDGTITFRAIVGSVGTQTFTYALTDGESIATGTVTVTVKPNTLFSDGFESGNFTAGGWTVSGSAAVITTTKASGTYSAQLKRAGSITKKVTAIPSDKVELSYSFLTAGLTASDTATVEVSSDNGGYVEVQNVRLLPLSTWQTASIPITIAPASDLYVRFRLAADSNRKMFSVDDVKVVAAPPANLPPEAVPDVYSTAEDTVLTVAGPGVLANDADAENQTLTAVVVAQPAHGSLALNSDGSFSYTPVENWNGTDTFIYKANDSTADSAAATVTITVNPVNDPPVVADDSYTMDQGTTLTIAAPGVLANDSDVDRDSLIPTVLTLPANGAFSLAADGSFSYTPYSSGTGTDSFSYTVSDNNGGTATGTVSITVTAVNSPPSAQADAYTASEDTTLTVAAPGVLSNDSDPDGQTVTAVLVAGPSNGTLMLNADGSFSYTPGANFNGTDSFTYKAKDASKESAPATVTITVTSVNDAPVAGDDSATTTYETAVTIDVLANDSDVDGGTLSISTPSGGSLVVNVDGTVTYTPATGFSGTDSFSYTVSDGQDGIDTATVTVTVTPVVTIKTMVSFNEMTKVVAGKNWKGTAKVTMTSGGVAVPGVAVWGTWTLNDNVVLEAAPLTTDAAGAVTFTSPTYKSTVKGTLKFQIKEATLEGYTYDSVNSTTSDPVTN